MTLTTRHPNPAPNLLHQTSTPLRTDIQALRGFAVLSVLLYHSQLVGLQAGYLGVDIFFVISGFLITDIVRRGALDESFSFAKFYLRRARRLLPAAYFVLVLTYFASLFLLTGKEFEDFLGQMIGSATFTSNFVLRSQANYFAGAADLKPLLHMWSLSIEEQYYLLLPAALVFSPRQFWVPGVILVLLASLVLCLVLVRSNPEAAFYLLPTRVWELMIGSLGALALRGDRFASPARMMLWPSVVALFVLPAFPISALHPGVDALVVCVATLVLILAETPALNRGLLPRTLARVGDMSYSLYLIHWPLFALAQNIYFSATVPAGVRASLVILSLILSYGIYRWIELPVHRAQVRPSRRVLAIIALSTTGVILVPVATMVLPTASRDYVEIRRPNYGFDKLCEFRANYEPRPECANSESPKVLVWGDSFAMHLVPGIAAEGLKLAQATRSVCGPFLSLAPMSSPAARSWAESCLNFNRSVADFLSRSNSVDVVVLSSPFKQYVEPGAHVLRKTGETLTEVRGGIPVAVDAMRSTVAALRALGKRVVVIAPPPSAAFDIGLCLERRDSGKPILGDIGSCEISRTEYLQRRASVLSFLRRIRTKADVPVISFDDTMCGAKTCRVMLGGTFIYRDGEHFSVSGSETVAKGMKLGRRILEVAR